MKKIYRFILSLQFIFRPRYWNMLYPYSAEWDRKLNKLLDNHDFKDIGAFRAMLGDSEIWISNHPYAAFTPYRDSDKLELRPSRLTIKRARKKLLNDMFGD